MQEVLRLVAEHPLRQAVRLDEEEPVEGRGGDLLVRRLEDVPGRHDVEQGEPRHPLGMVEGEPVGDPGAAIVADESEAVEAERGHDLDLVAGHRPLRVAAWSSPPEGFELSP